MINAQSTCHMEMALEKCETKMNYILVRNKVWRFILGPVVINSGRFSCQIPNVFSVLFNGWLCTILGHTHVML